MKVLTKNVRLQFDCWNNNDGKCPTPQTKEISLTSLIEFGGPPVCPICDTIMIVKDECLVVN